MDEHRHFNRFPATLRCRFTVDGVDWEGFIINVSSQGVGTTSEIPVPVGTHLDLLFLPANMTVPAVVCWCQEEKGSYAVGWLFKESAPEIIAIARKLQSFWDELG